MAWQGLCGVSASHLIVGVPSTSDSGLPESPGLEGDVAVAGRVLLADRRGGVGRRILDRFVEEQRDLGEPVVGHLDRADRAGDRAVHADVHPLEDRERVLELGYDLVRTGLRPRGHVEHRARTPRRRAPQMNAIVLATTSGISGPFDLLAGVDEAVLVVLPGIAPERARGTDERQLELARGACELVDLSAEHRRWRQALLAVAGRRREDVADRVVGAGGARRSSGTRRSSRARRREAPGPEGRRPACGHLEELFGDRRRRLDDRSEAAQVRGPALDELPRLLEERASRVGGLGQKAGERLELARPRGAPRPRTRAGWVWRPRGDRGVACRQRGPGRAPAWTRRAPPGGSRSSRAAARCGRPPRRAPPGPMRAPRRRAGPRR